MAQTSSVQTAFLIDDSEIDLFIQKRFLELNSFAGKILTFSSPVKALEALNASLSEAQSALIFLDLNMPLLNGFEFLERLNSPALGGGQNTKVVILSSSNSQEDRKRAMEFPNVINFISKPITSEGLQTLAKEIKF